MSAKNILIIGAGISGLSVLHYLKIKYARRSDIHIQLLEKNNTPGGAIQTLQNRYGIFEYGPNGFLDSKTSIRELTWDMDLESALIGSSPESNKRFLFINNQPHAIPTDFLSLCAFKPLTIFDKLRIPFELFVSRSQNTDETVYEFGARRFGKKFTGIFLDAIVQGIFAGDVRRLHLRLAFPRIYEIEQKYGSLLKGLICLQLEYRRMKRRAASSENPENQPPNPLGGCLVSFKRGMSQLIERLYERYQDSLVLNQEVSLMVQESGRFIVHSSQKVYPVSKNLQYFTSGERGIIPRSSIKEEDLDIANLRKRGIYDADELFLCVPAYCAAIITKNLSETLSAQLNKIPYVCIAVIGLVYKKNSFDRLPTGFGYLTPSREKKEVLGVLFDNHIFPQRVVGDFEQFRIMIGGAHHPQILSKTEEELLRMAKDEIRLFLKLKKNEEPVHSFVVVWPKGIPQYNTDEVLVRSAIETESQKIKNFHIVSNYLNGISINDCVRNAQMAVAQSCL